MQAGALMNGEDLNEGGREEGCATPARAGRSSSGSLF